ncbi:PREDICTED: homeobox-leucine zipper protein ATHB-12-like [Camelina sativa]|uniref:Homeobox-leucine zipper protein n=1 Tax=Camelina sativa TaxID=90675 RepID=A0ABM0WCA3_CAMSA|nr:PREDICTED: homeobox-leucine zipper protein ATHB-12-like [Camelina sativa]
MEEGDFFNCCFSETNSGMTMMNKKKMKKSYNQKRFSEEQIKSLERIFESETRLEPRKKVQVARELGLQPRQVAIWFQNKRARWKTKQLEKEYNILRANYSNLASQFDIMKKEKQALVSELQRLNEEIHNKPKEERDHECCGEQGVALSSSTESHNGKCEPEVRLNQGIVLCNDDGDNNNIKTEYFGFEEETDHHELMNIVEQPDDSCLTSSDNWGGFNSDSLLDQSSSNYPNWWEFWT